MTDKVQCATHGESEATYVCCHLAAGNFGLGFNRNEPEENNPFPDAWCDDCERIRVAHGGWNEESEKLMKIQLLCSGCYQRACIRNTRTTVTLDDLAGLKWKCGSCEKWHTGPCLDFGYDAPHYWRAEYEATPDGKTFLNQNYCSIEGRDFFVRGVIRLPIIGTGDNFCWGVWGSLSQSNFETLQKMREDEERVELPPMFSWLSSRLPEYPDTLNLKMDVHIQKTGRRPSFELEETDHPLSCEYHGGISPERVKEIMMRQLRAERC